MTLFLEACSPPRWWGYVVLPCVLCLPSLSDCSTRTLIYNVCQPLLSPHDGERPEDTHCMSCFPTASQWQVQGHKAGAQKTCWMRVNISSDRRLSTIEDTSSGPLHLLFPLLSVRFPSHLCSQFSYFIGFCSMSSLPWSLLWLPWLKLTPSHSPFSLLAPLCFLLGTYVTQPCHLYLCVHSWSPPDWTVSSIRAACAPLLLTTAPPMSRTLQVLDSVCWMSKQNNRIAHSNFKIGGVKA